MKKLKLFYWFYDFANSAYGIVLQNYLLPTYFSTVLINHWLTLGSWWLANGISTVIGVILWILAWKFSDTTKRRLQPFLFLIIMAFLCSLLLGYAIYAEPKLVFRIYIIANWFYVWSISVYNSLLTHLVDNKQSHEFSWFAWWFWYIWWAIWLISTILLQKFLWNYSPFIFIFVSLFFLVFSLISVNWIKKSISKIERDKKTNYITTKSKYLLLFWYWLISECITVIFLFFGTFVTWELKLSVTIAGVCMLAVQLIGLPSTIYWSKFFNKLWETKSMNIMVWIWFIAIVSIISWLWYRWLICTLILWWLVVWNSQSLMRSEYSNLIDPNKSWSEFGIFWFITQIGSFIWPIIYWYMSDSLWSQKLPLFIFWIFMIIWAWIINHAKIYKK